MTSPAADVDQPALKGPGFPEFVALIAMMMALNALAIDSMLPALPAIGEALGVVSENSRQWVITAYLLGFGITQIIYGPLADRFGRKPILMIGLGLYIALCLVVGGSSASAIIPNLVLQLVAVILLMVALVAANGTSPAKPQRLLRAALVVFGAIAAFQFLPLPPSVWSSLPGRGFVAEGFDLLAMEHPWLNLSLAPYDSLASLAWLLPAALCAGFAGLLPEVLERFRTEHESIRARLRNEQARLHGHSPRR